MRLSNQPLLYSTKSKLWDDEKYSPQSDSEFQNMLQLFISRSSFKFTVFIEKSLSFSSWTFPKVCQLYKLSEDYDSSLSVFPLFTCGCKELNDEKSQVTTETSYG